MHGCKMHSLTLAQSSLSNPVSTIQLIPLIKDTPQGINLSKQRDPSLNRGAKCLLYTLHATMLLVVWECVTAIVKRLEEV